MAFRMCLQKANTVRGLLQHVSHRPAVFYRPSRLLHRTCAQAEPDKEPSQQNNSQQQESISTRRQPQSMAPSLRDRADDLMTPFFPGFGRMSRYMDQMQREMDELMEQMMPRSSMLDSFFSPSTFNEYPTVSSGSFARQLAFEVEEDDKNVKLRAEVPGLSKDDIKVTLSDDNVLTIQGEKKQESKEEVQSGLKRTSQMYRSIFKQLRLPRHITHDQIAVQTKDGILTITLPKVEAEQRLKQIPVQ